MAVMDVTANGPAAQAGIEVGDVITKVNGKAATSIPVGELRRMLSDEPPGTLVRLAVKRGNAAREIAVTLRDQI
jgi:serine protease Do